MKNFKYQGRTKEGQKTTGEIEADDEKDARRMLRSKGIRPTKILPPSIFELDLGQYMVDKGLAAPFGTSELTNFTRQLAVMINAGVPILQSLEILYKQEKNPSLKTSIKKVATEVGGGKTLYDSLSGQKGFDRLYCNLVRAGEAGGILDTILNKLAFHMEKQMKIQGQVKSAMTYPTIVTIVGTGVLYVMLVFVVPKFEEMLSDTNQEVPWITATVIDCSEWLQANTIFLIPAIVGGFIVFKRYIKTPTGKELWDKFTMKVPLFGGIIIKGNLSSFTRTLATMLSAGVSLIDSLDICIETLDNNVIARDITKVRKAVTEGKTLTEPLMKIPYFPDMVSQMIKVGESTGNMDEMLEKIADIFEEEVSKLIEAMTKLIEPLILVVLGGIVAVVLIAMYMPIFMSAGGA